MSQPSPSAPLHRAADGERVLALLARNVRTLRSQRGMTRKGLAEQSGVSLPHLARLEGGQGNVSVLVLDKIARALNQPVANLFADTDGPANELGLIVELLRRQPPGKLRSIRAQLVNSLHEDQRQRHLRIALIGLRGAGKSSVGAALAQRLGLPFVELNQEVEREAGISLREVLNLYGQSAYRSLERRCLERLVAQPGPCVLATGGGIVAEPLSHEILLTAFRTVWLHADPEIHFRRVLGQHDSRIAQPALYREAMDNIRNTLDARAPLYRMAECEVDTSSLEVAQVVEAIVARLQLMDIK